MANTTITLPADPVAALAELLSAPLPKPMIGRMAKPYDLNDDLRTLEREALQITYAERASGYAASGEPVPLDFS